MTAYYNEIEPYAAEWLRNLIKAGHIPHGKVDTRSIVDVAPDDLRGFTQCHFFAGIGGWSHALRLAGWPDDRPIWTGSCPCQPFSVAGKGAGTDDPRHMWPHFHQLIAACRPPVVMGEQVAGAAGYGWLDGVRADLAREGYASRGVDIPACAIDAPHIRQRLYWVASDMGDAHDTRLERHAGHGDRRNGRAPSAGPITPASGSDMADANHERCDGFDALLRSDTAERDTEDFHEASGRGSSDVADAESSGWGQGPADAGGMRQGTGAQGPFGRSAQHGGSFWSNAIWLTGADGKARRSQPGLPLLVDGVSNRVGRLRAYGNAIVPPLAAEVIRAFIKCEP